MRYVIVLLTRFPKDLPRDIQRSSHSPCRHIRKEDEVQCKETPERIRNCMTIDGDQPFMTTQDAFRYALRRVVYSRDYASRLLHHLFHSPPCFNCSHRSHRRSDVTLIPEPNPLRVRMRRDGSHPLHKRTPEPTSSHEPSRSF